MSYKNKIPVIDDLFLEDDCSSIWKINDTGEFHMIGKINLDRGIILHEVSNDTILSEAQISKFRSLLTEIEVDRISNKALKKQYELEQKEFEEFLLTLTSEERKELDDD